MKKSEWEPCGELVVCTKCGGNEMMWCDVPIKRTGAVKRETRCEGCGDRITTKIPIPELSALAKEAAEVAAFEAADAAALADWEADRAAGSAVEIPVPGRKGRAKAPATSLKKGIAIYDEIDSALIIKQLRQHGSTEAWAAAEQLALVDLRAAIRGWRAGAASSATAQVFAVLVAEGWQASRVFVEMGMSAGDDAAEPESEQVAAARRAASKRDARREGYEEKAQAATAPQPTPAPVPRAAVTRIELLDLDAIHPESVQPREQIDLFTARDYAAQMWRGDLGQVVDGRGDDWTPIVVYREPVTGRVWCADGFHRCEAARIAGLRAIQAQVFTGGQRDALYHALGANARHGLRMTNADKNRVVGLILDDVEWAAQLSDTAIAARCGVTQPFVSKLRGERRQRIKAAETAERARDARTDLAPIDAHNGYGPTVQALPLSPPKPPVELPPQVDLEEVIASAQASLAPPAAEEGDDGSDEWSTPPEILELFEQVVGWADLDPASNPAAQELVKARTFWTKADNGLSRPWEGSVWLNPPYSYPLVERFAEKAVEEWKRGQITEMMILVNTSSAAYWFRHLAHHAQGACFLGARVKFWHPDGRKNPGGRMDQTIFYFGKDADLFRSIVGKVGMCWSPA